MCDLNIHPIILNKIRIELVELHIINLNYNTNTTQLIIFALINYGIC